MRIVHVADSFPPDVGGIESQVLSLARAEIADGHDVSIITAVNKEPIELGLDVHRGLRTRWLTIAFPWLNHKMVASVLDAQPRPDVIHAHFTVISPIAIYGVRAASARGIPVAVTVHSVWWRWALAVRGSFVPFFGPSRMKATWSGVSHMIADMVARTLPRVGKVLVVPNLVDVDWWAPTGPMTPTADPVLQLTLVGRLKRRKHIDKFLDILARVRDRAPEAKVHVSIVGDGPRREQLEEQIERLQLGGWVTLTGCRAPEQIRDLLMRTDLFVAPCEMEAFGIAALEARGAGAPVLAYGHTGVADFIEPGVEGYLVKDDEDMVETLLRIIDDPSDLDRIRHITRERRPSVTVQKAMDATYDLYAHAMTVTSGECGLSPTTQLTLK